MTKHKRTSAQALAAAILLSACSDGGGGAFPRKEMDHMFSRMATAPSAPSKANLDELNRQIAQWSDDYGAGATTLAMEKIARRGGDGKLVALHFMRGRVSDAELQALVAEILTEEERGWFERMASELPG